MFNCQKVVIGNTARLIPQKDRVHADICYAWTLYVRFEDPSIVKTVGFKLHESFVNNNVELEFPFEINEQGWGEFNIPIRISTKYGSIMTSHYLRLYNTDVNERTEVLCYRESDGGTIADVEQTEEEIEEGKRIERAILYLLERIKYAH